MKCSIDMLWMNVENKLELAFIMFPTDVDA